MERPLHHSRRKRLFLSATGNPLPEGYGWDEALGEADILDQDGGRIEWGMSGSLGS
ncbi:MAG: hypothetical protein U1D30_07185 [Planctomycetota bacterium]